MTLRSLQLTLIKAFALAFFVSIAITAISAAQDHDVPVSVDGIRCDSCGSECSVMCGSRNFRACCYNYIKKRSLPWSNSGGGSNVPGDVQDLDGNETQQLQSKSHIPASVLTELKSSSSRPVYPKGMASKHYFRGHIPEVMTSGSDSLEEAEFIYPVSVRDLVTSVVRNLNALENRKYGKPYMF